MSDQRSDIEASYDSIAAEYAEEFVKELARKPYDRGILDRFADSVRDEGMVLELGCGPGHIARYLKDRGVAMRGIDLSAAMIKQARRLHPDIEFERGDMLDLQVEEGSLAGIVCFYAIIHLPRAKAATALEQMQRALRDGGRILVSFHGGEGSLHRDLWYEKRVAVDVTLFEREEMAGYLRAAGLVIEEIAERPPYEFEYQTRRLYAFARKPEGSSREVPRKPV